MRRAQASAEYLTTYIYAGVALVVIVGALGYFGAYNPSTYAKEDCESGQQLSCADALVSADGTISIMITNRLGKAINLTNYTIYYDDEPHSRMAGDIIEPGENYTLSVATGNTFQENHKEKTSYTFDYKPVGSDLVLTVSGTATSEVSAPAGSNYCGDGIVRGDEQCEGGTISCQAFYQTYESLDTTAYEITGEAFCGAGCIYDTHDCEMTLLQGSYCGDGTVQTALGEDCEPGTNDYCPTGTCNPDTCQCETDTECHYTTSSLSAAAEEARIKHTTELTNDCCPQANMCVIEGACQPDDETISTLSFSGTSIITCDGDNHKWELYCNNGEQIGCPTGFICDPYNNKCITG